MRWTSVSLFTGGQEPDVNLTLSANYNNQNFGKNLKITNESFQALSLFSKLDHHWKFDVKGATDGLKLLTHREAMGRVV